MKRQLLFIAFPFPPSRGAGVYRTLATANFLASSSWKVTVVAPEENYFLRYQGSQDKSLMSWIDPRIDVVRVPLTNWYMESNVMRKGFFPSAFPATTDRWRTRLSRVVSPLEGYGFWFRPALKASGRALRRQKFHAILATGNPFNSFIVAHLLGKRYGIPYVLDYRDAWTFDQFNGELKPGATDSALALERRVLLSAAGVVAVNDSILDWLVTTHGLPGSVLQATVENGYDPEFVRASPAQKRASVDSISFAHVGTLVPGKLDWQRLFGEFDHAARHSSFPVTLDIWGHLGFSEIQRAEFSQVFESESVIQHRGPVEKSKVADIYADADALFLPLYESPYVTSGKVYEMMASRKPILAWGPATAGAMKPLKGYPLLVRAERRRPTTWPTAIAAVRQLISSHSSDLDRATKQYVEQFARTKRLRPLGNLIDRAAGSG